MRVSRCHSWQSSVMLRVIIKHYSTLEWSSQPHALGRSLAQRQPGERHLCCTMQISEDNHIPVSADHLQCSTDIAVEVMRWRQNMKVSFALWCSTGSVIESVIWILTCVSQLWAWLRTTDRRKTHFSLFSDWSSGFPISKFWLIVSVCNFSLS